MGYVLDAQTVTCGTSAAAATCVLPHTGAHGVSLMVMIAAVTAGVMVASRVITRAMANHQSR